jgi:signal transduction histidine kinase
MAAMLFTWAAVYAYVGSFYVMLHWRRPSQTESLAFGLACLALAVWAGGAALSVAEPAGSDPILACRVRTLGGLALALFLGELAAAFSPRTYGFSPLARRAAYGGAALGVVIVLGDAFLPYGSVEPSSMTSGARAAPPGLVPANAALAIVFILVAFLGLRATLAHARRDRVWLPFAAAVTLASVAGAHDTVSFVLGLRAPELFALAGLLPVLATSWFLMKRFVRATDELERRTGELQRSHGELQTTQEALLRKEQLAAVGELSAVIANEVRNPLAIIKNAVSGLRRPALPVSDRGVLLGILDEETDRLNRLVRDLLAYARPVQPRGEPYRIETILEDVIAGAVGAHPAPVVVELGVEPCPSVVGDPALVRHALENVVGNAVASMPTGGALRARVTPTRLEGKAAVEVQIGDTGAGMAADVLAKARDPFFTTRPSGTGLGLAIVDRVVRNHGGVLALGSQLGVGTLVRIVLPCERPSSVPPPRSSP